MARARRVRAAPKPARLVGRLANTIFCGDDDLAAGVSEFPIHLGKARAGRPDRRPSGESDRPTPLADQRLLARPGALAGAPAPRPRFTGASSWRQALNSTCTAGAGTRYWPLCAIHITRLTLPQQLPWPATLASTPAALSDYRAQTSTWARCHRPPAGDGPNPEKGSA